MEEGNATVESDYGEGQIKRKTQIRRSLPPPSRQPKNPNQKISSSFPARSRRVWSLGLPSRRRLFRFHHRLLLLLFHPSSHATTSTFHGLCDVLGDSCDTDQIIPADRVAVSCCSLVPSKSLFHSDPWYQKSGILGFFYGFWGFKILGFLGSDSPIHEQNGGF